MEQFLTFAWAIVVPILGFLGKWMINRVQQDLNEHKQAHNEIVKELNQVKLDYVHTSEMDKIRTEILARFDRFEDRLERAIK